MAVFSFIGPPEILNHENKREHHEKIKFTIEEQKLYDELINLSKTTKVRPRKVYNRLSYQIIQNKEKES